VAVDLVNGVNMASVEAQQWVTNAGWAFDVVNADDVIGAEIVISDATYRLGGCKVNKAKPILIIDIKTNKEYTIIDLELIDNLYLYYFNEFNCYPENELKLIDKLNLELETEKSLLLKILPHINLRNGFFEDDKGNPFYF
jgi:hypothetical protein